MTIRKRTALKEPEILPEDQPNCGQLSISPNWLVKNPGSAKYQFEEHYDVFVEALTKSWMNQIGTDCPSCGNEMKVSGKPKERPVLVHIVSLDDGGSNRLSNWAIKCAECADDKD